jgi:integrase
LALKWSDVDWLNGTLRIERSIVEQNVDEVKTQDSRRTLTVAKELVEVLKVWKQRPNSPPMVIGFSPIH